LTESIYKKNLDHYSNGIGDIIGLGHVKVNFFSLFAHTIFVGSRKET